MSRINYASFAPAACVLSLTAACGGQSIPNIGPAGEARALSTDFRFTEGPAADSAGDLYFSDVASQKIHVLRPSGEIGVFVENSRAANGLMFAANGELVACEMDGAVVAYDVATKTRRVIVDEFNGKRFNAPNDLVIDSTGGVYFTDPRFRAPQPLPQGVQSVYYVAADGGVRRVVEDLPAPNGVLLAPDERTLYVFPSDDSTMRAYDVSAPGRLGRERAFCKLQLPEGGGSRGADGGAIDAQGNLYVATALGVQVFSSRGERLGPPIKLPQQPSNCTFAGPDRKTLFVTARSGLYAVPMLAAGHRYPAGPQ